MTTWDDRQPIYQQLADRLAAALLDGDPSEGEAMPSVRALAAQHLLNPLPVGRGLFVTPGARERLRCVERERFLTTEWPRLRERLKRLDIGAEQLTWEEPR